MEISLLPGVTLGCITDQRFKQGCLSVQFLRPLSREETPLGTLVPAVLLRGSQKYPTIQAITGAQDDLYGSYIGAVSRKIRDTYACGFFLRFLDDRFCMEGDAVLAPMISLLEELLFHPLTEEGRFLSRFVESEKQSLIDAIRARDNDKSGYAMRQLIFHMAGSDTLGIPRLGTVEQVEAVTPEDLWAFYRKLLTESEIALFYVGSEKPETLIKLLRPVFSQARQPVPLIPHTPFLGNAPGSHREAQPTQQSHLCLGFASEVDTDHPLYAAMLVGNSLFGGGMTSKLFLNVRERLSLCYSVSSTYIAAKGLVLVEAGIDAACRDTAEAEILRQLRLMREGDISQGELRSARESLLSSLRSLGDSPSAMENFYSSCYIEGLEADVEKRMAAIAAVSAADVQEAFRTLTLHTTFYLEGTRP